jgi:hypothetical protein
MGRQVQAAEMRCQVMEGDRSLGAVAERREEFALLRGVTAAWWSLVRLAREIRSIYHQSQAIRREVLAAWYREVVAPPASTRTIASGEGKLGVVVWSETPCDQLVELGHSDSRGCVEDGRTRMPLQQLGHSNSGMQLGAGTIPCTLTKGDWPRSVGHFGINSSVGSFGTTVSDVSRARARVPQQLRRCNSAGPAGIRATMGAVAGASTPQAGLGCSTRAPTTEGRRHQQSELGVGTAGDRAAGPVAANVPGPAPDAGETPRCPRGPAKFFYDTTTYTGCARFGGAKVVDKENRRAAAQTSRRRPGPFAPQAAPATVAYSPPAR